MSKTLEERLNEEQLQNLQNKRFQLTADRYTEGTWQEFENIVGSVLESAIGPDDQVDYSATCLAASADPTKIIPGQENNDNEDAGFLVKVIARIPELHASIPKPSSQFCETEKNLSILMHPVFYSFQSDNSVPQPGNKIKVKFFTQGSAQFGEYLGVINGDKVSPQKAKKSPREAMECGESAPETLGEATARGGDA